MSDRVPNKKYKTIIYFYPEVQKIARQARKSIRQIFFYRIVWVWGILKICLIVRLLNSCLPKWCLTVQWLVIAVSNCPMAGQCCVQLFYGWQVRCLIVFFLEYWIQTYYNIKVYSIQNVAIFCFVCQTISDLKSYFIGQF